MEERENVLDVERAVRGRLFGRAGGRSEDEEWLVVNG